jgi:hypothetical protein
MLYPGIVPSFPMDHIWNIRDLMGDLRKSRRCVGRAATLLGTLLLLALDSPALLASSSVRNLDANWVGAGDPKCFETRSPSIRTFRQQVEVPASWRDRHLRLVVTASGKLTVFWNGDPAVELSRAFDLPATRFGKANLLEVRLDCTGVARCGLFETTLHATPRVYLDSETWHLDGHKLRLRTDIRNTLDNTVNLDLHWELSSLHPQRKILATHASAATIPPLSRQTVESSLDLPADFPRWRLLDPQLYELRIIMVKNAEAVEGDYDVELSAVLPLRTLEASPSLLQLNGDSLRVRPLVLGGHCYPDLADVDGKVLKGEVLALGELPLSQSLATAADRLGILILPSELSSTDPKWLLPEGSRPSLQIRDVYQRDGDSFVELENEAAGTPAPDRSSPAQYPLTNLQVRLGHREQILPVLLPGQRITLRFEHVNPYRIEVRTQTGLWLISK